MAAVKLNAGANFQLANRGLELSCRPIVKPHFHAPIRKIRLYAAQSGDFSPLFGPPSDFVSLGGHSPVVGDWLGCRQN